MEINKVKDFVIKTIEANKVLNQEYWGLNKNNEQTVMLIIKDAVNEYFKAKNTREKQEWYKMLIGSIDTQKAQEQQANTIQANNVIFLPAKQETVK